MNTEELLNERDKTHGDFRENARLAQAFKQIARTGLNWDKMNDIHREAFDMVFHKVARALTGDWKENDHYEDLAGYAKLPIKFNHGIQPNDPLS